MKTLAVLFLLAKTGTPTDTPPAPVICKAGYQGQPSLVCPKTFVVRPVREPRGVRR